MKSNRESKRLTLEKRILFAKIFLQRNCPFLYSLLNKCKVTITKDPDNKMELKTASVTSGGNLLINENFIANKGFKDIANILSHEVLHVALLHMYRTLPGDEDLQNVAADLVVNSRLPQLGQSNSEVVEIRKLSPNNKDEFLGDFLKSSIKEVSTKDMITLYKEILKKLNDKDGKAKPSLPLFDNHIYGMANHTNDKKKTLEEFQEEWKDNILEAATLHQQQRGKIPAFLQEYIDSLTAPKISYKELLYIYLTANLPHDFSWHTPSKKIFATGFYMPEVIKESLEVVVLIDTSASMSIQDLREALSEIQGIANSFANISVRVITHDVEVHNVFDLTGAEAKHPKDYVEITGRGGTSHLPVNKLLAQDYPETKVVIAFTDGGTSFPRYNEYIGNWIWVTNQKYETAHIKESVPKTHKIISINS